MDISENKHTHPQKMSNLLYKDWNTSGKTNIPPKILKMKKHIIFGNGSKADCGYIFKVGRLAPHLSQCTCTKSSTHTRKATTFIRLVLCRVCWQCNENAHSFHCNVLCNSYYQKQNDMYVAVPIFRSPNFRFSTDFYRTNRFSVGWSISEFELVFYYIINFR